MNQPKKKMGRKVYCGGDHCSGLWNLYCEDPVHGSNKLYDGFIRQGLAAGFTDDQIDFLAEWFVNPKPQTQLKRKKNI